MHWYQWLIVGVVALVLMYRWLTHVAERLEREAAAERAQAQLRSKREREEARRRSAALDQARAEDYRQRQREAAARREEAARQHALTVARQRQLANPTQHFYDWMRS
ncbi:hypothetical protein DW352_02695 [Pseudolabrys taiwanensis]|uniref:Uncharacterized protein n=1 Tax=Pseudolabrys taiwanensis TaxID=331696 RepID=A0A345ZRH3_9HYPH|nr:copper transporter family protein [Pseudolabrys taiwanensis]AXK79520.1 hypothetical protein DW352_02695 [Pseudolabrys taiwanensis]